MSGTHNLEPFPRRALIGAGVLVGVTLVLTGAVSLGILAKPQNGEQVRVAAGLKPVIARNFAFSDIPGGALEVRDADTGKVSVVIQPGEKSGFIRGVLRGMMRERKMSSVSENVPFALTLWEDQRLSLHDGATGRTIELGSFGADNRAAFMRLLQPKAEHQL
jgi:putative photosynthetic complex assembly protein